MTRCASSADICCARGLAAVALPAMPFGGRVISSNEALAPSALPKRMVVISTGYIRLELGRRIASWAPR